ncbi:LCP family protein [Atopobacter phocae]|uniref:LCP family glycopolymer transferase n=1 Tax=Atopobacter phocae TaxID=136492 RepID=UPI00046ED9BA|nr:LCP family protein [Atopobacter phocae]
MSQENYNQGRSARRKREKKRKRRTVRLIFLAMLAISGVIILKVFGDIGTAYNSVFSPIQTEDLRKQSATIKSSQPISILLMGLDNGYGDVRSNDEPARSDTMMLLTLNPQTNESKLLSLPRDIYTEIVGHNTFEKLNHAHAYGGPEMTINTIQQLINVPIDYYVSVNMDGLKQLVDAVGGIDIVSPLTFTFDDIPFIAGEEVRLDGERALAFSRMRYEDPKGDLGRQERQQIVVEAILEKATRLDILTHYNDVLDTLKDNVRTNLRLNDLITLQSKYMAAAKNIESVHVYVHAMNVDQLDYLFVSKPELLKVSNALRNNLSLDQLTLDDIKSIYAPGLSDYYNDPNADETNDQGYFEYESSKDGTLYPIN